MEVPYEASNDAEAADHRLQIIKYSPYKPCTKLSSAWFDLRVFYVRVSRFRVDGSTPEFLTLNHIPLSPDTLLELNGVRSSMYSDGVSSVLRRDRVDKKSEEATFVTTDTIRLTGSIKFEVYDKGDCILSGVLEMSNSNGFIGESKCNAKRWSMNCETEITASTGLLKGKHVASPELPSPTIEVYVAGCFSGAPIILTKKLQFNFRKKHNGKCMLDAIPEYETTDCQKDISDGLDLQGFRFPIDALTQVRPVRVVYDPCFLCWIPIRFFGKTHMEFELLAADFRSFKPENEDYNGLYWQRTGYIDGEDGELSWFNAGVRVGVGIGLGVCLGIGVGVGLLVRSYRATTRNFKRRFI